MMRRVLGCRSPQGSGAARVLVMALFVLAVPGSGYAQERYNLALMGASPGGLWSLLGAGITSAVVSEHPGSVVTYQTSGGGLANVMLVSEGRADLGIVHDVELKAAVEGSAPFQQPVMNLRVIAYLYAWAPMQLVITRAFADRYGIETLRDLITTEAPVRMGVNTRGNMVQEVNRSIFGAYGVTYEDVESWGGQVVFAASNEMATLMANRRIDMSSNGVFAPNNSILQSSNSVEVIMLPLHEEAIDIVSDITGARAYTVPAGAYEWLDHDVPTIALGAELIVNETLPDQQAYDLARALMENIDRLRGVHRAMSDLTPEFMVSQSIVPYHPGALRYYREVGLVD